MANPAGNVPTEGRRRPRITFGIIVLNGQPFIRYCLRAIYPFAHQIIVVEGAYWASSAMATPEGRSVDGTLEELQRFKKEEDERGIVEIVTKDGLWDGLTQQSQAWATRATGDYVWAVDVDEFYKPEDMAKVMDLLAADTSITMLSFKLIQFCFGFDYVLHSGRDFFKHGIMECRRVFKFGNGYKYVRHEPPTVVDPAGVRLEKIHYLDQDDTSALGIWIYHYTAIFRGQLESKARAYALRGWRGKSEHAVAFLDNWVSLTDPGHLGWEAKYYTWLERFRGTHPEQIQRLQLDVRSSLACFPLRDNADVERLISSRAYPITVALYRNVERCRVFLLERRNALVSGCKASAGMVFNTFRRRAVSK